MSACDSRPSCYGCPYAMVPGGHHAYFRLVLWLDSVVGNNNFLELFPIHYIDIGETTLWWAGINRVHRSYLDINNPFNWEEGQEWRLVKAFGEAPPNTISCTVSRCFIFLSIYAFDFF